MLSAQHPRYKQLKSFIEKLAIAQTDEIKWELLDLALTHPTISPTDNYEQLEFVGDAVVRIVASEILYEDNHKCSVGEFTAIRSMLVSDRCLAKIAESYGWGRYLLVSNSASKDENGLETRLADSFEAVLGALYLSTHNLNLIKPWLAPHFQRLIIEIRKDPARQNYKAALQEWTQGYFKTLPEYKLTENHQKTGKPGRFTAEVWFQDKLWGQGMGSSIKEAHQQAAKVALQALQDSDLVNSFLDENAS